MAEIKPGDSAYEVAENPQYDAVIRKLKTTDPAHAETVFNPLIQQIIQNIHAVKLSDDTKAKQDLSNVLNSAILEKVKAVGGNGSGLNADMVDGKHAADLQNYNNLTNKPAFKTVATTGNYNDLTNKPTIPTTLPANGGNADTVDGKHATDLQNYNNLTNKPAFKTVATTGNYNDLTNKPTIPTTLPANGGNADTVDGKHATDLQNYNNLTNKPTIPAAQIQSDWNITDANSKGFIKNKPSSLPANGGNADTVDGKHAVAFSSATNIVNGNGSGSIRTILAKSDYQMGNFTFAEGHSTTASGICSHAEGYLTTASGNYSHAEGQNTTASGNYSHAEGQNTTASGLYNCHAEGYFTTASGNYSHAEGWDTTASGGCSHVEGRKTEAKSFEHVFGHFNIVSPTEGTINDTNGNALIIGNGVNMTPSNAFRITYKGIVYSKGAYNTSGADYAELFEWQDGNPENQDRRGLFVSLTGTKIKIADSMKENIIGIISSQPAMIGNNHSETWQNMYLTDMWGDILTERKEIPAEYTSIDIPVIVENADGTKTEKIEQKQVLLKEAYETEVPIINPQYNPSQQYVPRHERKEWGIVGMLGQLIVQDDGSCEADGFCKCVSGGTVTKADNGYYVMERLKENYVRVLLL